MVNMISDVVVLISVMGMVLSGIITVCCWNVRRSRCVEVNACGVKCSREVMTRDDLEADTPDPLPTLLNNLVAMRHNETPQRPRISQEEFPHLVRKSQESDRIHLESDLWAPSHGGTYSGPN